MVNHSNVNPQQLTAFADALFLRSLFLPELTEVLTCETDSFPFRFPNRPDFFKFFFSGENHRKPSAKLPITVQLPQSSWCFYSSSDSLTRRDAICRFFTLRASRSTLWDHWTKGHHYITLKGISHELKSVHYSEIVKTQKKNRQSVIKIVGQSIKKRSNVTYIFVAKKMLQLFLWNLRHGKWRKDFFLSQGDFSLWRFGLLKIETEVWGICNNGMWTGSEANRSAFFKRTFFRYPFRCVQIKKNNNPRDNPLIKSDDIIAVTTRFILHSRCITQNFRKSFNCLFVSFVVLRSAFVLWEKTNGQSLGLVLNAYR